MRGGPDPVRMRVPKPLPAELAGLAAFSVADALEFGVEPGRLDRGGLVRPFHGVRATERPKTLPERCEAYLPRLRQGQFFSHGTAAVLLGMPVPLAVRKEPLHVSTLRPLQPPRTRGVIGHQLIGRPGLLGWSGVFPTTTAEETWALLGPRLDLPALVAAGDFLLRNGVPDPAGAFAELVAAVHAVRRVGAAHLEQALSLLRPGVRSAMESVLRILIVLDGLPEPMVNVPLFGRSGRFLGEGDLVYPEAMLVLEYEGDGHRTDKKQFRKDIGRREDFEDEGWSVLRITSDDVLIHRRRLLDRIRRRLTRPRPTPTTGPR